MQCIATQCTGIASLCLNAIRRSDTAQFGQQQKSMLGQRLQVKLQDVQSFYQEDGKSPFKHMPWKHGSMHFSYEQV